MLKKERKALVTHRERPQLSTGAKRVSAASLSKKSFLPRRKSLVARLPLSALYLLCNPSLWNSQDGDIHLYSLGQNKADTGLSAQGRLKLFLKTRLGPTQSSSQEQPPAPPLRILPNAQAHQRAAARLHQLSPGSFHASSYHRQMRSSSLGWAHEQQPNQSAEQLNFGTCESRQKCLLGPSSKLDNTSTYSSSCLDFTKYCFSATTCSLWEMPCFNSQQEGCLIIVQGSLWWSTLW